jgi:outer membrane biosynthesis protein TonB
MQARSRSLLFACALSLVAGCAGGPAEPPATAPPSAAPATDVEPPPPTTAEPAPPIEPDAQPEPEREPEPEPAAPPRPPEVEVVGKPSFVGDGEVPRVEAFLDKMRDGTAACVADHGGLFEESGEMKVQFLVRTRGRAEGIDVLSSKGVSKEAERCVRELFKNKRVGTPTNDPVGVQFLYRFKRA